MSGSVDASPAKKADLPGSAAEDGLSPLRPIVEKARAKGEMLDDILETLQEELGVDTAESFHIYFKDNNLSSWIKEVGSRKPRWTKNGPLCVALEFTRLSCMRICEERSEYRSPSKPAPDPEDEDEETPMASDINLSLQENWREAYGVPLHASRTLPSQILHSMYKKLKSRRGEVEFVKGLYTMASKTPSSVGSERKRAKHEINNYLELTIKSKESDGALGGEPQFHTDKNPHLYLYALENMLHSFALAGCFRVLDPEIPANIKERHSLMVHRKHIDDHIGRCRLFVIDWCNRSNRPSDAKIISEVKRVDMNIRRKWWTLFVENDPQGRTFTSCMKEAVSYCEQQWDQNFDSNLYAVLGPQRPNNGNGNNLNANGDGGGGKGGGLGSQLKTRGTNAKKNGKSKGGGKKGQNLGQSGQGLAKSFKIMSGWLGNKKVKVARNRGPSTYCRYYNHGNCREGDNCRNLHRCHVVLPNGTVCHGSHPASEHRGKFVEDN